MDHRTYEKLDHAVRELEKGVESVDFNVDGPYEVEHLSHSVQSMISTMRHLMEDVLRQEEESAAASWMCCNPRSIRTSCTTPWTAWCG